MNIPRMPNIKTVHSQIEVERFKAGLKVGASISGRITHVFGQDQYLVSLRGVNLVAQSDIPMKRGDRFKARIESTEPRLKLKIYDSSGEAERTAAQWGVKDDEKKVLAEMAAARMPMNRKTFNRINALVMKFSGNSNLKAGYGEIARAIIKLEREDLQPTFENLSRQLKAMRGDFDITELMIKLQGLLKNLGGELPEDIVRFLKNLPLNFTPEMVTKNLPAILVLMGLMHEANLKALLKGGKTPRGLNLKMALLNLLSGKSEAANILLPALDNLEAMQLRNLPENRAAQGDTYYLQLPIYHGGNWERLDLYFQQEKGGGARLDKNNVSIRINLDTRQLGKLSVLTDIRNGALAINFYCEREDIAEFIHHYLGEFEADLTEQGFKVRAIAVWTLDKEPELDEFQLPNLEGDDSLNIIV